MMVGIDQYLNCIQPNNFSATDP